MSVIAATRVTDNANTEGHLMLDVADSMFHVGEPSETPITTLVGGKLYLDGKDNPQDVPGKIKKTKADNIEYKVIEKDPLGRSLVCNGAVNASATTITFNSNTNTKKGDTAYNKRTGERIAIVAVDAGGANVTARRNLGGTSFTIQDDDIFEIVGYSQRQAGEKADIRSQLAEARTRYTQIFKRSFGISDTLRNIGSEIANLNHFDEERVQSLVEHKKDIEFSMWLNPQADSFVDADSKTSYITRGILGELEAEGQTLYTAGQWGESEFFGTYSEQIFKYGPQRKMLFASSGLRSIINEYARTKNQTRTKDTTLGITVKEIDTGHGYLEMVPWGLPNKFFDDSKRVFGVVLDVDRVGMKYIENRDGKYQEDIESPGDDAKEAQYLSELGLQLMSLKHHMILSPDAA